MIDTAIWETLGIWLTEKQGVVTKGWKEPYGDWGENKRLGYRVQYDNDALDYADCWIWVDELNIEFHYHNGATKKVPLDKRFADLNSVYPLQYGIPVSQLHHCFFLPSWDAGRLYCYDMDTGKLLWTRRMKHNRQVLTYRDYILCEQEGIGVTKLSYDGQSELGKFTMTCYEYFFQLNDTFFLIGPKRNKYYVVDSVDFSILKEIPKQAIHPEGTLPVEAHGTADCITMYRWENHVICKRELKL